MFKVFAIAIGVPYAIISVASYILIEMYSAECRKRLVFSPPSFGEKLLFALFWPYFFARGY